MKKVSLKKAVTLIFGNITNFKRTALYSNVGKEYSIYFTTSDGKMYNLFIRSSGYLSSLPKVVYREVTSYNDSTGSYNNWSFCRKLNDMGYYI